MACNHLHLVTLKDGRRVAVPCGFCALCRASRRDEWQRRLEIETLMNEWQGYGNTFLTLTVSDDSPIPLGDEKRAIQLFWKRIRKAAPPGYNPSFKYYLVSEYGSQTGRLHFHAIVCGLDHALHAAAFRSAWPHGFVMSLPVRSGAIRYVLKYLEKSFSASKEREIYAALGKSPPFRLISKGIGLRFFQKSQLSLVASDGFYFWHGKNVLAPAYVRRSLGIRPRKDITADAAVARANSRAIENNMVVRSRNACEPVYTPLQADVLVGRACPSPKVRQRMES